MDKTGNCRGPGQAVSGGKVFHRATHEQMRDLSARLVHLEQELHRVGMHATARATNRAVKVIGWEFAGDLKAAGEASRSDVP